MQKSFWQSKSALYENNVSPLIIPWLVHAGSFIQLLKKHAVSNIHIEVLKQSFALPSLDERATLNIKSRQFALIREVLIASPGKPWMVARTVIPRETLTGNELQLAKLKSRSLGSVLFKDPHLQRSEFEFGCIQSRDEFTHIMSSPLTLKVDYPLWARQSIFHVHQKAVLLTEIFFSELEKLKLKKV